MDCFSTIMNSYFILDINEIKSTISILSSLLMYTEMSNEAKDENNNVTFKYEWLNEHYEHFFTKMLPFIQFSLKLAKFDAETNEQIIESILVLLNYMIYTLPLTSLIKSDFISDSVKFTVLNTKKLPFTSLQITKTILSKIENNNFQLVLLSQNEQFELFDNLCKCLVALLNHNNHKTPSQLKEENLKGKLTIIFLRIFETIHLLGLKIDLFYSLNSDIRIHESACQLLNKTGAIIHSQNAFKFFENSDCLLTYILILKVCLYLFKIYFSSILRVYIF